MLVRARAPMRLGLAGGGSDVSPFCDIHGGYVLNATVDRYAYAVLKESHDGLVHFRSTDKGQSCRLDLAPFIELNGDLNLHRAVYNEIVNNFNNQQPLSIELTTFVDAPIGSGLGSSSTLVVVMIKAFAEYLNLALDDYAIASIAYKVERIDCGLKGGRQDQYSAAFGGFNFIEFYQDRTVVNPLRIKDWVVCELEASMLLFYTGLSRESSNIIADQSENVIAGKMDVVKAMQGIKAEALSMKESLIRGDFVGMMESMRTGWEDKKRTARTVSNEYIDCVYDTAMKNGALAGKVSGAGGGGFMMFFVPTEKRAKLISALGQFDGYVSNCHFSDKGAHAWIVR